MAKDKAQNNSQDNTRESASDHPDNTMDNTLALDSGKADALAAATDGDTNSESSKTEHRRGRKKATERHFPWVTFTILVVIATLAAGNYWQYQSGQLLRQSQQEIQDQLDDAIRGISTLNSQISQATDQQQSLVTRAQQTEQSQQALQATLEQMSQQLKAMATAKGKEPLYWKVSEVEYLLSVANHRLLLERDVVTAQAALQDADKRLGVIGDPGLIPIRKKLAGEIDALKQVVLPDISGIASQLSSMADTIENLPYLKNSVTLGSSEVAVSVDESEGNLNFLLRIVKDIAKGLFTIQRSDEPIEPLLPPQEKQYLKHNLSLKLEEARIALLNEETELFQKNLAVIDQWIRKYFDDQDPSVSSFLQTVDGLKQTELHPALPDISNSLRDLRTWLNQQKQAAANTMLGTESKSLAFSTDKAKLQGIH